MHEPNPFALTDLRSIADHPNRRNISGNQNKNVTRPVRFGEIYGDKLVTYQPSDVSWFARRPRMTVRTRNTNKLLWCARYLWAKGLVMPSELSGIVDLTKLVSKPEPIQVILIWGLKRADKLSVHPHWSKGQFIVVLAAQAAGRINLPEVIKVMTLEASDR